MGRGAELESESKRASRLDSLSNAGPRARTGLTGVEAPADRMLYSPASNS